MIYTSNDPIRRILTSPAVHPCEDASPATLVSSLISLAGKIADFKAQTLASAKRDGRSAIRLAEVLLVFLEEIREKLPNLNCTNSDSISIGLSEIHVVLQRISFLVQDCARRDARLWMLAKSDEVARRFRIIGADLATALEIFPVSTFSPEFSDESKDCVAFVARQARKLGFEPESGVRCTLNLLDRVIKGFERGVIPDPNDLKQILSYLGISNWEDCDGEIRFLEAQIESSSTCSSSLLGFMVYSRCVVFEFLCREGVRQNVCVKKNELFLIFKEEDFRCPISLEIMTDPVTISTGHTYDRASIAKWFGSGNQTCPKTGERLQSLDWVPNLALKNLARQYAIENGIGFPKASAKGFVFVSSPVYENAVRMAFDFVAIKLAIGDSEERKKCIYEIRLMTKRNVVNRALAAESGVIPVLLNHLKDSSAQENSVFALLNLSKHAFGKSAIVEAGGLDLIATVLSRGITLESKQHAAAVLFYLSSIEENRRLVGEIPDVIPALTELVVRGTDHGKKTALVAIFGLLMHTENRRRFLGAGLVPVLANLLKSFEKHDLITDSLAILSVLGEDSEGASAILKGGVLETTVAVFCSSSFGSTREHCVSLLHALCVNGGRDAVRLLAKNPVLMGGLYGLLTSGTRRASKKARSLIGILHEFSEKGSDSRQVVPRRRFIHVW